MATFWTCQRTVAGVKCGQRNAGRKQKCTLCGKPRPARKRPAHMSALDVPYEEYVRINGGEHCGICGRGPTDGRRLNRDHDHETGEPRGLLCWIDNKFLRRGMTIEWMRRAIMYLERAETRAASAIIDRSEMPPEDDPMHPETLALFRGTTIR